MTNAYKAIAQQFDFVLYHTATAKHDLVCARNFETIQTSKEPCDSLCIKTNMPQVTVCFFSLASVEGCYEMMTAQHVRDQAKVTLDQLLFGFV